MKFNEVDPIQTGRKGADSAHTDFGPYNFFNKQTKATKLGDFS